MRKRTSGSSSRICCASASLRQNFFEELQGARIVGLPKPEHRLLAHRWIPVRLRHFDQLRPLLNLSPPGSTQTPPFLLLRYRVHSECRRGSCPPVSSPLFAPPRRGLS